MIVGGLALPAHASSAKGGTLAFWGWEESVGMGFSPLFTVLGLGLTFGGLIAIGFSLIKNRKNFAREA